MTVREVAAVSQVQTENGVARLQHGGVGLHVRLRAGVGLHIGVFGAEQFLSSIARQILHHIRELATAVVALARISLRILVGEHRACGFEHGLADEILRANQLQALVLAAGVVVDSRGNLRIGFVQRAVHFGCGIRHVVFLGCLVDVGPMKFHVSLRSLHRGKANF